MKKKTVLFLLIVITIGTFGYFTFRKNNLFEVRKENTFQNGIYAKGKNLFVKNCASCHYIGMDMVATAPALGGITTRREKKWLYDYTRNSYAMFQKGDPIAKEIRKKGWGLMTSFPKLTDEDLDAIYYYVEKRYEISQKTINKKKQ